MIFSIGDDDAMMMVVDGDSKRIRELEVS